MANYRRAYIAGGTYFFTVNLLERHGNDLLVREIELLRNVVSYVRHVDYLHVKLVKHRLGSRVRNWPYSSFHRDVKTGICPIDWCGDVSNTVAGDV